MYVSVQIFQSAENAWLQIMDSYQVPFSFSRKAPEQKKKKFIAYELNNWVKELINYSDTK
jgi:hypothetical protein